MSDEDKKVVDEDLDENGNHPENVPWSKYVGVKEVLTKKESAFAATETELKNKVSSLEEQIKNAPNAEEVSRLKTELEAANVKVKESTEALDTYRNKNLTDKREALKGMGIPDEKVKDMSEKELDAAFIVMEHKKPGMDMGGGGNGGGGALTGSPVELARRAYSS